MFYSLGPSRKQNGYKNNRVCSFKIIAQYATNRVAAKVFASNKDVQIFEGRLELDTHADTFVAGRNCLLMHYTERVCDVMPYSDDYEAKKSVPIVQVATGYTNIHGERYILIFNEALWMPNMTNSLMNPNQLRDFGLEVQDNPYSRDPMVIEKFDDDENFIACLKSEGTNIFIESWTPTPRDLQEYPRIVMTSPNVRNKRKLENLITITLLIIN